MRLLVLTPEFDGWGGGIITFYRALLPALRDLDVDIRVIEGSAVHTAGQRQQRSVDGIAVETLERARLAACWARLSAFESLPTVRRHLAAAWAMWEQAVTGADFDIIEACDWGLLFVPPVIEGRRPCVVQCHGSLGQIAVHDPMHGDESAAAFLQLLEHTVMARATGLQSCSTANAEDWSRRTGRPLRMIRPAWRPAQAIAPATAGNRALIVGRIQRWKGPQVLCEAMQRLGAGRLAADWYGRDIDFEGRNQTTGTWLAGRYPDVWTRDIVAHSPVPPAEIARLQSAARFNIVPSTWDVFNFTGAEAMASGRPAIISDGAGVSELIVHGENGFVFRSGDGARLASVLDEAMSLPDNRLAGIGRAAQATIAAELDPGRIATQRLAAYHEACTAFQPRASTAAADWLETLCFPEATSAPPLAFLDDFPVRDLASYVLRRARKSLIARLGGTRT